MNLICLIVNCRERFKKHNIEHCTIYSGQLSCIPRVTTKIVVNHFRPLTPGFLALFQNHPVQILLECKLLFIDRLTPLTVVLDKYLSVQPLHRFGKDVGGFFAELEEGVVSVVEKGPEFFIVFVERSRGVAQQEVQLRLYQYLNSNRLLEVLTTVAMKDTME